MTTTETRSAGDPTCTCPEFGQGPEAADCPLHGAPDDLPTHMIPSGAEGGPGDMPAPPEHDCPPEALYLDSDHGWVCQACGLIIGGLAAPPAGSKMPAQVQNDRDPIGGAIRVLDPSVIQGPQEFAEQLLYMVERTGAAEFAQRVATHEVAEAETAYRRAYDRAVVARRGQGSADVRAAEARVECDPELSRLEHAKAVLAAIKGAGHSWRSMISGYQTAAGLVRDTYQTTGRYGT